MICLNHFVLIEVCSVDTQVACLRICTGFVGDSFTDACMRALWSDRQHCSHNVSQKVKRVKHVSDWWPDMGAAGRRKQSFPQKFCYNQNSKKHLLRRGCSRLEALKAHAPRQCNCNCQPVIRELQTWQVNGSVLILILL